MSLLFHAAKQTVQYMTTTIAQDHNGYIHVVCAAWTGNIPRKEWKTEKTYSGLFSLFVTGFCV